MNNQFYLDRIAKAKLQIVELEEAIDALIAGNIVSYSFDTGQTKQTATKADIGMLQAMIDALMNRIIVYEARLTGGTTIIMRPAF